jgi:hypothetical protein
MMRKYVAVGLQTFLHNEAARRSTPLNVYNGSSDFGCSILLQWNGQITVFLTEKHLGWIIVLTLWTCLVARLAYLISA